MKKLLFIIPILFLLACSIVQKSIETHQKTAIELKNDTLFGIICQMIHSSAEDKKLQSQFKKTRLLYFPSGSPLPYPDTYVDSTIISTGIEYSYSFYLEVRADGRDFAPFITSYSFYPDTKKLFALGTNYLVDSADYENLEDIEVSYDKSLLKEFDRVYGSPATK